ncbi:uncharacterized protein LOC122013633 [Zingiber officinale]|uniref:uncharacterized protein LOC122013633 n=1 Tax=Zingiber officinale TaxID=94328 RepID=UPI001C4D90D5|nr:uncharacterized protein LOC122013633 [Zingiber officinale]
MEVDDVSVGTFAMEPSTQESLHEVVHSPEQEFEPLFDEKEVAITTPDAPQVLSRTGLSAGEIAVKIVVSSQEKITKICGEKRSTTAISYQVRSRKLLVSLAHLSSDQIPLEPFSQLLISRRPSPSNSSSHALSFQLLSSKPLSGEPLLLTPLRQDCGSRKRGRAHQRKGSGWKASGREGKDAHAIPSKESSGKRQVMQFRRRRAWGKDILNGKWRYSETPAK